MAGPEKYYKEAVKAMEGTKPKLGTAFLGFTRAAAYGYDKDFRDKAAEERDKLFVQWQADIAPIEKSLQTLDQKDIIEARKLLNTLYAKWDKAALEYRKEYAPRLREAQLAAKAKAKEAK